MTKLPLALHALCRGNLVSRHLSEATSAAGHPMSSTAFAVLAWLQTEDELTTIRLQEEVGVGQSTLSGTLTQLVADGWVEIVKQESAQSGRKVRAKHYRMHSGKIEEFAELCDAVEAGLEERFFGTSGEYAGFFHFNSKTPFNKPVLENIANPE